MKKRIISMVLALTMIMGILTGCGAGSGAPANSITVSEMLNSIVEEKGEVEIYARNYSLGTFGSVSDIADKNGEPKAVNDNAKKFQKQIYDGKTGVVYNPTLNPKSNKSITLKELMSADEASLLGPFEGRKDKMRIYVNNDEVTAEILYFKNVSNVYFGSFSREEIAGESYMVFRTYEFRNDNGALTDYHVTVIKDTEYTKDKTIVFDSIDLEGAIIENSFTNKTPIIYTTSDINWTPNK